MQAHNSSDKTHNKNRTLEQETHESSLPNAGLHKFSQYLTQAILLEVTTAPKPGLVTRLDNGSHKDMSIFTFMMSSGVLSRAFYELQELGRVHTGTLPELLVKVRSYGVVAEQELLAATKNVNTQRGILFAGGLLCAAAGYAVSHAASVHEMSNSTSQQKSSDIAALEAVLKIVQEMTAGIVDRELKHLAKPRTYGEKLYAKYGITGIRGEVEQGFPSVLQQGLPALEQALDQNASLNDALVHALLSLMTVVEDSNVLWRTDYATAQYVKQQAAAILAAGSVFTEQGRELLNATCTDFVERNISPGGCADLLSVTIALYLLAKGQFPGKII